MKRTLTLFLLFSVALTASSQEILDTYITNFSYESTKTMRVNNEELAQLLIEDKAILLDIRFKEEQQSWLMPYAVLMPLPDLPANYKSLDKTKIIITACPQKDRSIIAMMYLKSKGYEVMYLSGGLLGLADHLKGGKARAFINKLE
jgi:rhodanese-related sulfurtransferase